MSQPWGSVSEPVTLGQPGGVVTLIEGNTFCISGRSGDIRPGSPQGFFYRDARFLSQLELLINGMHLDPLSTYVVDPFVGAHAARVLPQPGAPDSNIFVMRRRYLGDGFRENISISNYDEQPARLQVELGIGADFVSLFDVKQNTAVIQGEIGRALDRDRLTLRNLREGRELATLIRFSQAPTLRNDRCFFEVALEPQQEWQLCIDVSTSVDGVEVESRYRCGEDVKRARPSERISTWRESIPVISTDFVPLARAINQGQEDLGALRIFDPDRPERPIVAAGAPWFMAPFGRDSLITAWMALLVDPSIALGTLQTLAEYQGTKVDNKTEEEPGRILHEMRFGDAAYGAKGRTLYYGSSDATPLFVMLLGELRRWGLARELVERLLPHADRALDWIENYGDRDGDGYVEYQRAREDGLVHQGWKDSTDAVRYPNGKDAKFPIAICEIQGYVYGAYVARMHFAEEYGDTATAEKYRDKAATLKRNFNRDFWIDELQCYALALDGDKQPVKIVSSDVGHCLWTGIVDEEKAGYVANRFMSPDMFSGWGIRTVSASTSWYNPISYHGGAVWPHDSAIAAAGLMRYGFVPEAQRIVLAILEASMVDNGRLPEVFSGLERSDLPGPVIFPTSCSPQAWAAASPMLGLRTLLRFDPSVTQNKLFIAPVLPPVIRELSLDNIPLNGQRVSLQVHDGEVKVIGLADDIEVVHEPRGRTVIPA
jgi:glycogen debranching enzyme